METAGKHGAEEMKLDDRSYFRRREAAEYIGLSVRTLDQLKADGDLPFCKIGAVVVFTRMDLDTFMMGNRIAVGE